MINANVLKFDRGEEVIWAARDDRGYRHDLKAVVKTTGPKRCVIITRDKTEHTVSYKWVRLAEAN